MTFGSLFAGIGGFDKGFTDAGMRGLWNVEKEKTCRQLLANKFPDAAQFNDVQTVGAHNLAPVDVVCGGFPCQDLSVAGKRAGLAGLRSGLFFEMTRIVNEIRPAFLIWENVPGLLSSNSGKDFLVVLLELERIGYSGCWTTLDARWFGVAQRRRRVFGVFARGDIGAAAAAQILALQARMSGHFDESQEAGRVSPPLTATGVGAGRTGNERNELDFCIPLQDVITTNKAQGGNGWNEDQVAYTIDTRATGGVAHSITTREGQRWKADQDNYIAFQQNTRDEVRMMGGDGAIAGALAAQAGMKQQNYVAFNNRQDPVSSDVAMPLGAKDNGGAVAWHENKSGQLSAGETAKALRAGASHSYQGIGVRRLTPTECERLQGFPDGWTDGFADSTRYKMLGNAVAVPCARWIGRRIVTLDLR